MFMPASQSVAALVERVCASAPPGQEERQADRLEDAGKRANGDGVKWTFLREDLSDEL